MKKLITILFLFACSFAYAQSLPNVAFPTSEAVADTYTVNITNYGASYNDKVALINFRTANSGPATLNITPSGGSALGARPLRKFDGSDWVPLASGDLRGDSSLYFVHYSANCGCLRIVPQGTGSASIPDLDQVLTQGSTANIANLFAVTSTSGGFNIQSNESGVSSSVIGTTVETTLEWDNGVNYGNLTMDVNGNRFTGSETFSFAPTTTESGLNVGSVAGDPSSPENGDLWYDQTANELTARINGANVALGAGGGGDIEIGTTNVTGGTNTRVLYNNSGVAGEYAISGTGNVAMTSYVDAKVEDNITDGATTTAPSENAVFDALALKQDLDSDLTSISGVSWIQGDLPYLSGSNTWARLAKATSGTQVLTNTGTSNNPAWTATSDGEDITVVDGTYIDLDVTPTTNTVLNAITITADLNAIVPATLGGTGVSNATQTYTPTLSNTTNVAASTAYACIYYRVGNMVTVSGRIDIDPTTTATLTTMGISLPIASDFTTADQAGGTAAARSVADAPAAIFSDATNNRLTLQYVCTDVTNHALSFTVTYQAGL